MIRVIGKSDLKARTDFISHLGGRNIGIDSELLALVSAMIDDVRQRGDQALIDYAARFDNVKQSVSDLRVSQELLRESATRVEVTVLAALREAIDNVRIFHERQRENSWFLRSDDHMWLGQRVSPLDSVGLYVPGGTAAYPSSVVMNVVPAQVAGVNRIVVVTPPETIKKSPAVAAALVELGVDEIYETGGAQAIAALTYGTQTVPRVDKITGPGNKYVAAAKKLVFGVVGIDSIAGPSEVVILADESGRPDFIAADLLAQAEHGDDASAVLITTSELIGERLQREIERQLEHLPRRSIIETSLRNYGGVIVVESLTEACEVVNELAPEHVELHTLFNDGVAEQIKHAGAIFFGPYSPEAIGDYFAGPNHVLPTARTARFSSALGVYDFVKRTTFVGYSKETLKDEANKIAALARAEGLQAHERSALIRVEDRDE